MKNLNMFRLCRKVSQISFQRSLNTGYVLSARQKRKTVQYTMREPGIQNRKMLYADPELPETEYDDEDFIHEESLDFENIDKAYDEDIREQKEHRKILEKRITYNKYFRPPKQPAMLTYNEIECIKYLHESDPVNWDVRALSESFPATPDIIKKILKAKYKLNPERAKKKDEAVYKNWKLLADGKLEADPKIIEHYKKFINRREVLLEQIKNTKFYLPEVKVEPTYNNGEMSKILMHYEKQLEELKKEKDSKILPEGVKPEEKKKKYLDLLNEEVEKVMSRRIIKKESDTLRQIINTYSKEMTYEELENKTIKRAENNKKISLAEKAILECKFGTSQQYTEPIQEEVEEIKPKRIPRKLLKKETTVLFDTEDEKTGSYRMNTFDDDLPDLQFDEKTRFTKEIGVGQLLNEIKNPVKLEEEKFVKQEAPPDPEIIEKENEHFDKQVEDIKSTPFWNNTLRSKEKAELELQKGPLQAPSEFKRISKVDIQMPEEYPLRIPIPKSKRGSGLTFRVKDCFYDDDGEFLYRVPGMVLEKTMS